MMKKKKNTVKKKITLKNFKDYIWITYLDNYR